MKVKAPEPTKYYPKNNLNENISSTFKANGRAVFGKDNSSIIDKHFNMSTKNPGPGEYGRLTEFATKIE